MKRATTIIGIFLLLYVSMYGIARWRKFIVLDEIYNKEEMKILYTTAPGLDIRANWRGNLKNRINPIAFGFFTPLRAIEDTFRGRFRPISPQMKTARAEQDAAANP